MRALDLSEVRNPSRTTHDYISRFTPTTTTTTTTTTTGGAGSVDPRNFDPFTAAFKHHAEAEAPEPEILQPIHSVGAVHRAYKQREKEEELVQQKRHAAKVVKIVKNVNNASSTGLSGQAGPQGGGAGGAGRGAGKGKAGRKPLDINRVRMVEGQGYGASTVSSLGHDESTFMLGGGLDQDDDMPAQDEPAVVIDNLDYSEYSCNDLAKNEILARVRRCLTAGTAIVLRTIRGGDMLDGKMLLKTISNHHASYTDNGYIVPPIFHSSDGLFLELELKPKKMF